jgi:hypothetical protein
MVRVWVRVGVRVRVRAIVTWVMVRLRVKSRVNPKPYHNHNLNPYPNQSKLKTLFDELFACLRELGRTPPAFASVRQVFAKVHDKKLLANCRRTQAEFARVRGVWLSAHYTAKFYYVIVIVTRSTCMLVYSASWTFYSFEIEVNESNICHTDWLFSLGNRMILQKKRHDANLIKVPRNWWTGCQTFIVIRSPVLTRRIQTSCATRSSLEPNFLIIFNHVVDDKITAVSIRLRSNKRLTEVFSW